MKYLLSLCLIIAFAAPSFAQSIEQRLANLEANYATKADIARLEAKIDALAAQPKAVKAAPVSTPVCDCGAYPDVDPRTGLCRCNKSGCACSTMQRADPFAPSQQMVWQCSNGQCQMVPAQQYQQYQPLVYYSNYGDAGGGGCANGSCGSGGGRGFFGRRR